MSDVNEDPFDQWLRQTLAGRPLPHARPDLAQRAMARAKAARILHLHRRWKRWSALAALVVIVAVIAAGGWMLAAPLEALWSAYGTTSTASTSASSFAQLSASVQWMLIGASTLAVCVMLVGVWRMLTPEDAILSYVAV